MTILVVAEHNHNSLHTATLKAMSAAVAIGGEIHLLVAGCNCASVAEQARAVMGVSKVLLADSAACEYFVAENIAPVIAGLAGGYSHIIAPATSNGKNILPRVAALIDSAQISEITAVLAADRFTRPIYAGNAVATVQSGDKVKVITVRVSAFAAVSASGGTAALEMLPAVADTGQAVFISKQETVSERPELTSARVVVSGGRGLGSKENFAKVEALATKLGAAVGASRAAVDAGYCPNDYQVGQTGKIVAPELYMALAISGAIQHLAGMKESKVIVAVNKDENAPIFEVADYGLVMDVFEVMEELGKLVGSGS
jgi:electron transfer flavoprotein alpha subunit